MIMSIVGCLKCYRTKSKHSYRIVWLHGVPRMWWGGIKLMIESQSIIS